MLDTAVGPKQASSARLTSITDLVRCQIIAVAEDGSANLKFACFMRWNRRFLRNLPQCTFIAFQ